MYIRRKVFSVGIDEYGEERLFSTNEVISEESYLDQREFNSKAQKLLRNKYDVKVGMDKIKELKSAFRPELVGSTTVQNAKNYARESARTNKLVPRTIHDKITKKGIIRDLQKKKIYDDYIADTMVQDTISPGLSARKLVRSLHK